MKCHNWNHVAWECVAPEDICGTCGGNDHWTKDCTNREKRHCVSCNSDDHASWSRTCPTFLRKCDELDRRTPENNLPFYPASEPWTWSPTAPTLNPYAQGHASPPIQLRGRNQQERIQNNRDAAPNGRPYERASWNRTDPGQTDKPCSTLPPPSIPSLHEPPEQSRTNSEPQIASSLLDDIYE
jgi:hypothetical protein